MTAAPALPLASPARLRSQIGRVGWLLGAFAGSAAIVILTMRAVSRVAGLFPDAVPAHPYFLPAHAGLLYVVAPIAVLAACVFLLLPGVTLALALGGDARLGPLLLKGLALTFPLHTLAEWVVRTVHGGPMTPDGFLVAVAVDGTLALGLLAWRVRHGRQPEWPVQGSAFWRRLGWLALVPTVAVVGFLPDIFWQDLSADGWEAFEMGRSLASHVLPRFPTPSGTLGLGIGMVPMTYPVHWFGMIFGLAEPAPRLPCLMYLMLLYAALTALIELASPRVLRATEEGVLFLCVAVFAVALGFNASYSAYFADLASPGGLDILTAALLAGLIYFLWSAELSWFLLFAGLSYLARPTALLVLLLLGIAALGFGGRHRSQQLRYVALALGLSVLVMLGYELIFARLVGDGAHPGYDSQSVIERFRYLQFHDPARLLFAVLPGGLAPFAALLAFRRQDAMARSLALVTVGYLLVFLFPAFTNMHHFVPAMILPIAVAG
ncbi:MAG TPA: hypothetical protein VNH46_01645, partial [Gemmatimonadales bacterium]|nr:hypothetical protein [Gemmatimonadales bacterium]